MGPLNVYLSSFIGIGSNLNNPIEQAQRAVEALQQIPESKWIRRSPWFQSYAVGPAPQPDFINGVVELSTRLSPRQLLGYLEAIEAKANRERVLRWGPRTLDLDILLFGNLQVDQPGLKIPHPCMLERDFVVLPLLSIWGGKPLPDGSLLPQVARSLGMDASFCTQNCWPLEVGDRAIKEK